MDKARTILPLIRAAEERGAAWQDISTAPKDGRTVLLWFRTCKEPGTGWYEEDEDFETRPKWWRSPRHGWRNEGDQCIPVNQEDCTHWMPLPLPPIKEG